MPSERRVLLAQAGLRGCLSTSWLQVQGKRSAHRNLMLRTVMVAVAVGVTAFAGFGCGEAASSAASHRKTCTQKFAEHRYCAPLQWHEENEGPSVYNHFHSTYAE